MKKNKMMRIASALLVATLLSTCAISGTFAKYVTKASASDNARVAKWGVVISGTSDIFDAEYDTDDGSYTGAKSVVSSVAAENVVAPGTTKEDIAVFTVSGTPEVATRITFKVNNNTYAATDDIWLAAGTYADMTTGDDAEDTFTVSSKYVPVVYTLSLNGTAVIEDKTLEELITALQSYEKDFDPNTDLSSSAATFTLSWKWVFYVDDATDKADTLLGDLAAGIVDVKGAGPVFTTATAGTDFNLRANLNVEMIATQID